MNNCQFFCRLPKTIVVGIPLIYVVYHYSRKSTEGGKYSVISGIQRISRIPFLDARNPHCSEYPLIHEILVGFRLVGIPSSADPGW